MIRQYCNIRVENILSERDSMQACVDAPALQILRFRNLTKVHHRLEQHRGRSAASLCGLSCWSCLRFSISLMRSLAS